jgi:hypothetical protein
MWLPLILLRQLPVLLPSRLLLTPQERLPLVLHVLLHRATASGASDDMSAASILMVACKIVDNDIYQTSFCSAVITTIVVTAFVAIDIQSHGLEEGL